jgi:oligopeptide/dipeptide ABC transporter ATP-binding protein
MTNLNDYLLEIRNLKKYFPIRSSFWRKEDAFVHAVDDVTLKIKNGETIGIVGESGSGKTTLGYLIANLLKPTDGKILFQNSDITNIKGADLRKLRKYITIVYQDPFSSLNPRMKIQEILGRPLSIHEKLDGDSKKQRIKELLDMVGLSEDSINRYPHEFSGGQKQRISIARALSTNPKLVVLDEPTSSLDVSVQAKILKLLTKLQKNLGLTYLFISHNLSVVRYISDRIAVMYAGKIIEVGTKKRLFNEPSHPYTKALLAAIPVPDLQYRSRMITLPGEVPNPANPPQGCRFHPRCTFAESKCKQIEPYTHKIDTDQEVACHLFDANKLT